LVAVVSLGVVGYGMALLFILFGAPDLAMTQIMVETLTVILFALVLYRLPRFEVLSKGIERLRDAVVTVIVGSLITVLVLAALHVPQRSSISHFFAEKSYPEAHGRNIVNVILVDFRGFDTLGEITVLAVAGIGIFGLLRLSPDSEQSGNAPLVFRSSQILKTAARLLLPLMLLISVFVLVRGHNATGGGFVGGLLAGAAFALYAIAQDTPTARSILRVTPRTLIGAGLLTALGSGVPAILRGQPFMTGRWLHWEILGLGNIDFGTPLVFDAGVYLVVLGATTTVLLTLLES
jgi:multisubunit Na+/H+ antiporter MnhB subunit